MKSNGILLALAALSLVGCRARDDGRSTVAERKVQAQQRRAEIEQHGEKAVEPVKIDWQGPGRDWDADFARFAAGRDKSVDRGEYTVERAGGGSFVAWRKIEPVAGGPWKDLRDRALAIQVEAKLAADEDTRDLPVKVDADEHTVRLSGKVRTAEQAGGIIRLALSAPGAERVISRLSWR